VWTSGRSRSLPSCRVVDVNLFHWIQFLWVRLCDISYTQLAVKQKKNKSRNVQNKKSSATGAKYNEQRAPRRVFLFVFSNLKVLVRTVARFRRAEANVEFIIDVFDRGVISFQDFELELVNLQLCPKDEVARLNGLA